MERATKRVPRRFAGRARISFAFALTILLPLAVMSAPGCGTHATNGGAEPTGTTQQALGGPNYTTTGPAPISTSGGATVYQGQNYPGVGSLCQSTSVYLAAQCFVAVYNAPGGECHAFALNCEMESDEAIEDAPEYYPHPCSYYYSSASPQYSYFGYNTSGGLYDAECLDITPITPSANCSTGYIDETGTCAPAQQIPLGPPGGFQKDKDPHLRCDGEPPPGSSGSCSGNPNDSSPAPDPSPGCNDIGMCAPNATKALASLNLNDTPVGYKPQKGPDVHIGVSYNHLDTLQPASPNYGNLGPRWTHMFNAYVIDDATTPGNRVSRYAMGGGDVDETTQAGGFSGYPSYTWNPEVQGGAVLKIVVSGSYGWYVLTHPDGTVETYYVNDGATSYPRKFFLTEVTDPQGNSISLSYDGSNRLKTITDAESRVTNFCYDPTRSNCSTYSGTSLLISQITDPFGRSAVFSYDSYGRLSSIQDVLGITSSFTYDGNPGADGGPDGGADPGDPYFISQLTTPYGNSTFVGGVDYSQSMRWLELTDPDGNTERVEYDQTNSSIGATESATPSGMTVENGSYNANNTFYWNKYQYALGYADGGTKDYTKAEITHWTLGPGGLPTGVPASIKRPLENRVYYTYPGQSSSAPTQVGTYSQPAAIGRVLVAPGGDGGGGVSQVSTFTYNAEGYVLTSTDPIGRTLSNTYAANGIDLTEVQRKISSTPTYATLDQYTYDSSHDVLTHTDAAGQVWRYCYNAAAQLTQVVDPANYSSGSSCSGAGYGSVGTRFTYDGTGRMTVVTNAAGNTQLTNTYPGTCSTSGLVNCDLPSSVTDSEGRTVSFTRDALDRVTTTTYPDSTTDVNDYTFQSGTYVGDPSLELRKHTDRLSRVTTYGYDADRRLTSVTDPLSHTVTYGYFADGTLNTLEDQNSHTTTWGVDVESRPTTKTFADSTVITTAYDGVSSRVASITDALSQVKTYGYNVDDTVSGVTYTASVNTTPNVSFSYDTWYPRKTGMTDGNGTSSYSYIAVGTNGALSPLTETPPFSNAAITWAYDADGRPNSLTVGGGTAETWSYDALGRPTSHVTGLGTWTNTFLGQTPRIASRTLGATGISTSWSYDSTTNDQRLLGITNAATGASPGPRSYTFSYGTASDGGGPQNPYNIMRSTQTSGGNGSWASQNWTYTYDNIDRLLTATGSTAGLYTYALDGPGNLTTWTATGGGSTSSPTYSNVNELTSGSFTYDNAGEESADSSRTYKYDAENRVIEIDYTGGSNKTTITYDGLGRRVQVAYYNGSTATTRYAWCGSYPCEQRNGSDTILKRYYAEGELTISGSVQLVYMPDQLGSVRDVVNVSGPSVAYSVDYTPYGAAASTSGSGATDFGFAGMVYDPNSSLSYSASRFYDPASGRWIHRDFIAESGGIDLFAYAGGNPINKVDPAGTQVADTLPGPGGLPLPIPPYLIPGTPQHAQYMQQMQTLGENFTSALNNLLNNDTSGGDEQTCKPEIPDNVGPGPYAGPSVPAGPSSSPTSDQQEQINQSGDQSGCHTCGTNDPGTKSGNWVGDHQPPTKLNPPGNPQVYLPQCLSCSRVQGGRVRQIPVDNGQ